MMSDQFSRTRLLLGEAALKRLHSKRVAVFGIGGVGGYVCEALVRSGIGAFDLIDNDKISLTNLNRQIIATHKTIGKYKTDVMCERMMEINPDVEIETHNCFFLPDNAGEFAFCDYDYVVDAIDTVTSKIELIVRAQKNAVPIISAMGAGNKLNPERLKIADIYETRVCPLARVMRRELKNRGIKKLKVVYSDEEAVRPREDIALQESSVIADLPDVKNENKPRRKDIPGSTAFVPATAGLLIAAEIVRDLIKE